MSTSEQKPRVLAVLPARGGSRGLPDKNLRTLCGLPLICHAIEAAALIPSVTRAIVTTDSERIARVARDHGGDVPFLRPPELAQDRTPMAPVLRHALAWAEEADGAFDLVLLLDPTSPARSPDQIEQAIDLLWSRSDLDGVVSVSEPTFHPSWVGVRVSEHRGQQTHLERYSAAGQGVTRRQDVDKFLRINGNFYVWRSSFVRDMDAAWFDAGVHAGFEIAEAQAFSIDTEYEFRLIEALVQGQVIELPWMKGS